MVGAVTVLIAIVSVFLAYNANNGLPFVDVYSVSVEVPSGARLGTNNEVRIGGTRVGVIEKIEPVADPASQQLASAEGTPDGELPEVAARLYMKLDKAAEPLPVDSIFRIRYRSAFGLKYVEIIRGTGEDAPEGHIFNGLDDGETCAIPIDAEGFSEDQDEPAANGCFQDQNEFDSINNTFNRKTRMANRDNLVGFGGGFAARGTSLYQAIQSAEPLFENLRPVAIALTDESTRFKDFFPALARTADIVEPVAREQAEQFAFGARTFEAISRSPDALRETISEGPPTLETAIRLLPAQRTFLSNFADVSADLNPGVRDLRFALPDLNEAVEVGTPVLERSPEVNRRLEAVFVELNHLVQEPTTRTTLMRLGETFDHAEPLFRYVAPAQTVCNYWNYFFTNFANALSDQDAAVGNAFRQILVRVPAAPAAAQSGLGGYSGIGANGITGPANSAGPGKFAPYEIPITNTHPYGPTGQNAADCQSGQAGYPLGKVPVQGQLASDPANRISDLPGTRGPTTLFWDENGNRQSVDTRVASRAPETWRRVDP